MEVSAAISSPKLSSLEPLNQESVTNPPSASLLGRIGESAFNALAWTCLFGTKTAVTTFFPLSKTESTEALAIEGAPAIESAPDKKKLEEPDSLSPIPNMPASEKLAESFGLAWKAYGLSLLAIRFYSNRPSFLTTAYTSAGIGIGLAVEHFFRKPSAASDKPPMDQAKALACSIAQGIAVGAATLASIGTLEIVEEEKDNYHLLAALPIGQMIHSYLRRSEEDLAQEKPTSKWNRLSNTIKSVAEGALTFAASIGIAKSIHSEGRSDPVHFLITPIILSGIISAVDSYLVNTKKDPLLKKTLDNLTDALKFKLKGYGATYLGLTATQDFSGFNKSEILIASTLVGSLVANPTLRKSITSSTSSAIDTVGEAFSKIPQKWREASTTKKVGVVATSLAALAGLGVLCAGPEKVYDSLVYSSKTETTNKTIGEWIKGYSDLNEMTRLAGLTENINGRSLEKDVFCAQILQTCDIAPEDPFQHKMAWHQKAKKFHPDHYQEPDKKKIAQEAFKALNKASGLMKEKGICSGQDEIGCTINDKERKVTFTLKEPRWIFQKVMEAECLLAVDDEESVKTSLDDCKHLI